MNLLLLMNKCMIHFLQFGILFHNLQKYSDTPNFFFTFECFNFIKILFSKIWYISKFDKVCLICLYMVIWFGWYFEWNEGHNKPLKFSIKSFGINDIYFFKYLIFFWIWCINYNFGVTFVNNIKEWIFCKVIIMAFSLLYN